MMRRERRKRVINILLTFLLVSLLCFFLSSFAKGDRALYILGDEATEEALTALRHQLGDDRGHAVRYLIFLRNFFTFNWGVTMTGEDMLSLVLRRAGVTMELTLISLFLAISFSLILSLLSWKRKSAGDRITEAVSLLVFSMPAFLLAILLMVLFSYIVPIFPVSGYVKPSLSLSRNLMSMALPSISMALMHGALYVRVLKRSLRAEMGKEYITGAKARGKKEWTLPCTEALRPASISFVGLIQNSFSSLILGSAVTETVFNLPGLGSLIVSSALKRDIDTITTVIMIFSVLIALSSIIFEMLAKVIDPRAGRKA